MTAIRFIQLNLVALLAAFGFFYFKTTPKPIDELLASNTYMGPTKSIPGKPQLVRVEVLVRDSADASGPQVVSVDFNKNNIPLKPRDITGNRGSGSFQLAPGTYKLRWVTNQNKRAWPRNVSHEEEVTISPRDLWIQIQIEGENATIS